MDKAIDLFIPGGRQRVLPERYVVQGVPIVVEHTDACHDQTLVQVRLPGDMKGSWGIDVKLPTHFKVATVEQLDAAIKEFFDRYPDPFAPCPKCGQMTWNRKRWPSLYRDERCGDCWHADFAVQMAEWARQEQDAQHTRDVAEYHAGHRWRHTAIIHPQHGDDFVVDLYTPTKLTGAEVVADLRKRYPTAAKIEPLAPVQLPEH